MLSIKIPPGYAAERTYIVNVLLEHFLGLEYQLEAGKPGWWEICNSQAPEGEAIILPDVFFQTPAQQWLQPESLPALPLPLWDVKDCGLECIGTDSAVPVLFGRLLCELEDGLPADYYHCSGRAVYLGLDIFGVAFFMLTRYEELAVPQYDQHDRFPAAASLAERAGFLERPLVNEYLEILWCCMQKLWPRLKRRLWQYQVRVSHDVDVPLAVAGLNFGRLLRNMAGDVLKRSETLLAARRLSSWLEVKKGHFEKDINYTFDWIMNLSEKHGLKSTFFFKAAATLLPYDQPYSLQHPALQKLLQAIHYRGHEVGLHPSYETFLDPWQIQKEFQALQHICAQAGVQQAAWGGRQHYLRWRVPHTWQAYADAGLQYDSTLSFADRPGFRCGVCYPYPVFNLQTRQMLNLWEIPLIVMEGTLLEDKYMGLPPEGAREKIVHLARQCRCFSGTFTLLWHNSSLVQKWQKSLYENVLVELVGL